MRSLTARILVGASLLGAVLGLVLLGLLFAVADQRDASRRARGSEQAIATAERAERLTLDVQTSLRGYLLSGSAALLAPFRSARAELPPTVGRLVRQSAGDAQQEARAQGIRADAVAYVRDVADPTVARARSDGLRASRALARSLRAEERADELRAELDAFTRDETARAQARRAGADRTATRAQTLAIAGLVVCLALMLLYGRLLFGRVVRPVRDLAQAAERVRGGDLHVEVPVPRGHEVSRLTQSFNAMARSLEQSRDELESQNTELETQAIELEDRQAELAAVGDELRAQRDELETTTALLAEEKQLAELFGEFAERLAGHSDLGALAALALDTLAGVASADVGALYGPRREATAEWTALAVRGLPPGAVPPRIAAGGEGVAARAVAEGRPITASHEDSGLRVRTLGGEAVVRHELHIGLQHGARAVGLVTLGRLDGDGFGSVDLAVVRRLANQAAVALAELASVAEVRWLVQVNRVVLDSVREGIALLGRNGRVILANAAIERIAQQTVGASAAGTIERGPAAIAALTRDPAGFVAAWERMLSEPDEPTFDEFEVIATGRTLQVYTASVEAPGGRRMGRLVVIRDVTDERQAERLKSDLMSTVSHELRTPLASVLGYTELLRTRELEPERRERILAVVYREAQRLSALIDDFLDLQRIEEERLQIERRPFRIDELLDEQVRTFAGQSQRHQLELEVLEAPLMAAGDRRRIAQVVANLLSNAIKYSPGGGRVHVEGARRDGEVLVAVSDEGLGIPTEQQGQVFEKFFRVARPEVHEIGGTGLGLALAHEIVVAHEGRIGFESVEGQGSRFWFTLPGG